MVTTTSQVWKEVNALRGTDRTGSSVLLGFLVVRFLHSGIIWGLEYAIFITFLFNNVEGDSLMMSPFLSEELLTADDYLGRKRTHLVDVYTPVHIWVAQIGLSEYF